MATNRNDTIESTNNFGLIAAGWEAALLWASQLEYITDMRNFVARYQLAMDTSGDGRMLGVKSSIKAQILAWCVMRLLALRRALELRTIGEMRAFIKEHAAMSSGG